MFEKCKAKKFHKDTEVVTRARVQEEEEAHLHHRNLKDPAAPPGGHMFNYTRDWEAPQNFFSFKAK